MVLIFLIWLRHPPPKFKDSWGAGITFVVGTNLNSTNVLFGLSATSSDLEMINILGAGAVANVGPFDPLTSSSGFEIMINRGALVKSRTDREYDITFHQNHPMRYMSRDAGFGKPARSFDGVTSLVLNMYPQIDAFDEFSTNTEILSGSVEVTVNSSLTWEFEIPPQIQRLGIISSKQVKNAEGKIEVQVMPVSVMDSTAKPLGVFDGK